MNINFTLAQFEGSKNQGRDLFFLFSSWRKMKLLEEKVPVAPVLFESLIVCRNLLLFSFKCDLSFNGNNRIRRN